MEFFNKLGKKASEAYQATKEKASDISEELKIKTKINSLEEKVYEIYAEIGEKVYNEVKDGKDVSKEEISGKCEEISSKKDEMSRLHAQLLTLKKMKKCVNCGEKLDIDAEFCSKCGTKQPKTENVEVQENPEEGTKDAEVIEINNVEENKKDSNEENK